jgi:flagellar motor switch protein FliN/FliY
MTKDGLEPGDLPGDAIADIVTSTANEAGGAMNLSQIMKIPIDVKFVLGCAQLSVEELMQLAPGSTINTSAHLDDKIDIVANGRVVARGELVVVNQETSQIGIMVSEVVGTGYRAAGS